MIEALDMRALVALDWHTDTTVREGAQQRDLRSRRSAGQQEVILNNRASIEPYESLNRALIQAVHTWT